MMMRIVMLIMMMIDDDDGATGDDASGDEAGGVAEDVVGDGDGADGIIIRINCNNSSLQSINTIRFTIGSINASITISINITIRMIVSGKAEKQQKHENPIFQEENAGKANKQEKHRGKEADKTEKQEKQKYHCCRMTAPHRRGAAACSGTSNSWFLGKMLS